MNLKTLNFVRSLKGFWYERQAEKAKAEQARLRRKAENDGLDPEDPTEAFFIALFNDREQELTQKRQHAINQIARQLMVKENPEELDSAYILSAFQRAEQIYDLTSGV